MKILVCEDDLITLKTLEYGLKKEGYEVLLAPDGKTGADLLKENVNEIGLMITDQHMPYNSGLELVHLARNDLQMDLQIIMLTKVNIGNTRKLALSLGVNNYVTKPFHLKQLLLMVKSVFMNPACKIQNKQ